MGFPPIAIVGQGCVLPGALTPAALWDLVRGRRSAISKTPRGAWGIGAHVDPRRLARSAQGGAGGYVGGFDEVFDPEGFLLPADDLRGLDPLFLWALHAAREALRCAGVEVREPNPRGGVILGNLSYPSASLA